jgi:hypothetical protein
MASSDSVNLRHSSTSANTGKAPKYLGRRQSGSMPVRSRPNVMPYLAQLSNAEGESHTDYRYETDGSRAFVYVVDSGLNWRDDIFNYHTAMVNDVNVDDENDMEEDDVPDYDGTGTNVAALAAGKYMGVTSEARLGVIKVTFPGSINGQTVQRFSRETVAHGAMAALDDIVDNSRQKSSVICLSLRKYIVHTDFS